MVYDEAILDTTIATLEGKLRTRQTDQDNVNDIYRQLILIKQRYEDDGVTQIPIIDPGTTEAMTSARKDEIYDKCKPLADAVV